MWVDAFTVTYTVWLHPDMRFMKIDGFVTFVPRVMTGSTTIKRPAHSDYIAIRTMVVLFASQMRLLKATSSGATLVATS